MVDRIWWHWQQVDRKTRNYDFSGYEKGKPEGDLNMILDMAGFAPNKTVREFMVATEGASCFRY